MVKSLKQILKTKQNNNIMFDIGWAEFLLFIIVAVVFIGPKEMPAVLHFCGKTISKARRFMGAIYAQFDEVLEKNEQTIRPGSKKQTKSKSKTKQNPIKLKDKANSKKGIS